MLHWAEISVMRVRMEEVLRTAGIEKPSAVEVLRDGFPSYVIRVSTPAFSGHPTVIVKACPSSSMEPDVLLCLSRAGVPVPRVLDVKPGDGFRAVIMEDVGTDALYKHRNPELYIRAVREIAGIHRRFDLSRCDGGIQEEPLITGGAEMDLLSLLPRRDPGQWTFIVRGATEGTGERLKDGTYIGFTSSERDALLREVEILGEATLAMLGAQEQSYGRDFTLVHGDFHDGNILIKTGPNRSAFSFVIVDWDSARLDSGFFDLVSLYDVAERMQTSRLDPRMLIEAYVHAKWPVGGPFDIRAAEKEWRRCRILRAWDELRWFSTTGDDFGDRVRREVEIIRRTLGEL